MNTRELARTISIALVLLVTLLARSAESGIIVAWDANPEPEVIGYRIYVGTAPGVYSETYDVGRQTTFEYSRGAANVRYHFAVAAVAPGGLVGPLSAEVVGFDQGHSSAWSPRSNRSGSETESAGAICAGGGLDCYVASVRAAGLGKITDLTPTPDGRVLFIEERRRIRVLARAGVLRQPALESHRALTGLALDPLFAQTGELFVGESEPQRDGTDALAIVRYRELGGQIGGGATVIAGLRLARGNAAPFTLDSERQVYVALPRLTASGRTSDPYEGHVLRINPDGSVPADGRGASPLFAASFSEPTALVWASAERQLWLAGAEERRPALLTRVDTTAPSADGLRQPAAFALNLDSVGRITSLVASSSPERGRLGVFLITEAGGLYRGTLADGSVASLELLDVARFGVPVGVAVGQDAVYVAIRTAAQSEAEAFAVISLTPTAR